MTRLRSLLLLPLALLALAIGSPGPVRAQATAKVVTTCASQTYTAGQFNYQTIDLTGDTCGNAVLSGSVTVGSIAGTSSNATDAQATTTNNIASNSWLFGFNGTTWDRLRDDTNKYLYVDVANASIAIAANSSVNVAQVNGVTTSTGAGAIGTGTQRVGVAQDTTTIAGSAPGTAGSASANVVTVQGIASGTPIPVSGASAPANDVTAGPTGFTGTGALAVAATGSGSTVVQATGSGTGLSFVIQGAVDTTPTWQSIAAYTPAGALVTPGTALTANGSWVVPSSGWKQIRINLTAISGGTETFTLNSSAGSVVPPGATVTLNAPPNDTEAGPFNVTGASLVPLVNSQGSGSTGIEVTGTYTGASFLARASVDGTNYFNVPAFNAQTGAVVAAGTGITPTSATTNSYFVPSAGWRFVQADFTAVSTGTAVVTLNASAGSIQPLVTPSGGAAVDMVGCYGVAISATVGCPVQGETANNATAAGKPIAASGTATATEATAATTGQNATLALGLNHKLITEGYAAKEYDVSGTALATSSTASTSLVGVPGSNLYLYITHLSCFNSGATSTTVLIQNGSGGTTIYEGYAASGGGGFTAEFPTPLGGIENMTANTALYFQAGSSTASLICNAVGYKGS